MKKGVVVLGYSLKEQNWEYTIWGEPPNKPGRVVTGTAVVLEESCELMIISGGATEREGKSEAWWMKEYLYERLETLKEFQIYSVFQKFTTAEIKKKLDETLCLEEESRNTRENFINSGKILSEAGIGMGIVVTSGDHISRAHRDAQLYWRDYAGIVYICGIASYTLYSFKSGYEDIAKIENVVIAEPPVAKKINLARVLNLRDNPEAIAEIDKILRKFGQ